MSNIAPGAAKDAQVHKWVEKRLEPKSPPGSRPAEMFFDKYPRFYDTSETSVQRGRLNLRHEAMIAENAEILAGARVLDIASHDGRWSFAALKAGAVSVVGIEAKADLVGNAYQTFKEYDVDPATYDFVVGDIFEVLATQTFEVDVVMCLGFLYHTFRYNELLSLIRGLNPRHLIVDTSVSMGRGSLVRLTAEPADKQQNAVTDRYSYGDTVLVAKPNMSALKLMLTAYGFPVTHVSDWGSILRDNPGADAVNGYATGVRATVRCDSV